MKNGQIEKEVLDQYFTPDEDAEIYAKAVVGRYGTDITYIEPSAGDGAFIRALVAAGVEPDNIIAFDLDPKVDVVCGVTIHEMDFFDVNHVDYGIPYGSVAIGNPPYGKGGSLAMKFMNHLCSLKVRAVCFLNPICVGNKHFTLSTIDQYLHMVDVMEFEEGKHFRYPNSDKDTSKKNNPVRCQFQIWERKCERRPDLEKLIDNEIIRVVKVKVQKIDGKELALGERNDYDSLRGQIDFTVVSHGNKAGTVIEFDPSTHKSTVKMFVHVKRDCGYDKEAVMKFLREIDLTQLTKWSTIRHNPSIAPSELIEYVNKALADGKKP